MSVFATASAQSLHSGFDMSSDYRPLALVTGAAVHRGGDRGRLVCDGLRVLALDRSVADPNWLSVQHEDITYDDLANLESTTEFLDELIRTHGVPTRLALNAGVWPGASIVEMSDEIWNLNFAVNVSSPFAFMRALAPEMARVGGGAIVCTASRNAHRSSVNNAAYDASKAALLGLVRTAAGEFASDQIRVNAVSRVVSTSAAPEIEEPLFGLLIENKFRWIVMESPRKSLRSALSFFQMMPALLLGKT